MEREWNGDNNGENKGPLTPLPTLMPKLTARRFSMRLEWRVLTFRTIGFIIIYYWIKRRYNRYHWTTTIRILLQTK